LAFNIPRLLLRPFDPDSESDVAQAFAIYSDPRVVTNLSGVPVPDPQTQQSRMRERNAFYTTLNNGTGVWAIVEKTSGQIIGAALLKQLPLSSPDFIELAPEHEIGWHLAPSCWGHGFATGGARKGRALERDGSFHSQFINLSRELKPFLMVKLLQKK